MKPKFSIILVIMLVTVLNIFVSTSSYAASMQLSKPQTQITSIEVSSGNVVYKNTKYGFDFTLPNDWKGYSVVNEQWMGTPLDSAQQTAPSGPQILIRSPKWTIQTPTQDIPVMVFTLQQWQDLQQNKFAVSAAPIPPSELGQNSRYVFALPPRYNFAFLPGYQEVEQILQGKPLHANENFRS